MTVLYLIDTLEVGGAETSILEIASRLKNYIPIVVYVYNGDTLKSRFEEAGIKVYSLEINHKFGFFKAAGLVKKIIKKENPDIIHATLFKAEMVSRIVGPSCGIPVINSFVNDSYSKERYNLLGFSQRLTLNLYKWVDNLTSFRVTKFMSITNAIIENNAKAIGVSKKDVEVIYRGRNIEQLKSKIDLIGVENLASRFGTGPIILTVSRLLIRKGYLESIEAMKSVVQEFPLVKYLIAGEGHDRPIFENLIKSLELQNNVFLLGNRKDVPTLLEFSDVFLFPSHYEGQGGALVEAMILGKPIIASEIPVLEESVTNERSAILFKTKDIEDLTLKIKWALSNKEKMENFGNEAKLVAQHRFNIEKVAMMHDEMYDRVISKYTNLK